MIGVWQAKKLGDLCRTGSGGTPLKARRDYYEGGTIPWLLSGEVAQGEVREAKNFITREGLENSAAKIFPKDTVLVAMYGATAGQVGILRFEAATNQAVCGVFPSDKFIPEFLFYFLLSRKDELIAQTAGNAQPNISQVKIRNIDVPVVTLLEQERIVSILDQAFAGIATAKTNAEKNLQNARSISVASLVEAFAGLEAKNERLGNVTEVQSGGTPAVSQKGLWSGGVPWYSSGELNEFYTGAPERTISDAGLERSNAKLFPAGSLLIGMYDTAALKMSVLDRDAAFNQAIAGAKPSDRLDTNFLLHAINAQKEELLGQRRGVRQKNLSLGKIKDIRIPLPPLSMQKQMVTKLRDVMVEVSKLETLYQRKLTALDELRQSLLHQAFSGQL